MNRSHVTIVMGMSAIVVGIGIYLMWHQPASLSTPQPTLRESTQTSTDVLVHNVSMREITSVSKMGWELTAASLDINPHTQNMAGRDVVCTIVSSDKPFGHVTAPQVSITAKTKDVLLHAPVVGTFNRDINITAGALTYHHQTHVLTSPEQIKCTHPHGEHTAQELKVDAHKKIITLSGGVVSVLYPGATHERSMNRTGTKRHK